MTSPNHDAPTTPGWAAPTSVPQGGPQDSPVPVTGPAGTPPGYAPGGPGPGYGAPGYPTNPGYGPPPGYRPPAAEPGIIPLRPLSLGEILDGAFRAIRANPRVMFGVTALVVTIMVALQTVFEWYIGGLIGGYLGDATESIDPNGEFGLADSASQLVSQLLTLPALAIATTILTGLLIVAVSRSVLGQTVTIAEIWRAYRGRVGQVLVFTIVLTLISLVAVSALVGAVVVAVVNDADVAAILIGLLGALAYTVGYLWLLVRTLLIPPAIMLEGAGIRSAARRGWMLTRGSFWRLLGIYLLTSIIVSFAQALIVGPTLLLSSVVFQDPLGTSFGSLVVVGIGTTIGLTLTTVFTAAVVALLYVDVRMRREGLDVELARAAGESAA